MTSEAVRAPRRSSAPSAGSWADRPAGVPGMVPPPSVPLAFLSSAAIGLVACGVAWVWVRGAAASDPTADPVVAAAHLGMLATLSMGVLGALHQFTPVVSQRPLRSIRLARATFASWLAAAWMLPLGIGFEQEGVVEAGGGLAALAIALLVVNLSSPLAARGRGAPLAGLRLAVAGFVVTACFGVLYVADRRGNWFDLSGHVVLAHAIVGLFAWLGLAYVAVAEKLWPMFFLAHVPGRRRAGWVAVCGVPGGVALLSPGLLLGQPVLGWLGAAVLAVGLAGHLTSLVSHVGHRRRRADLHLLFVATSALWLLAGAGLALAAGLVVPDRHHLGVALVAAAVAAFGGWLLETLVGHVHKVVPFIVWSWLRSRGVDKGPGGRPLMFSDLYGHRWAGVAYGLVTSGIASLCVGLAASLQAATAAGGALLAATAVVVAPNLSVIPLRMVRRRKAAGPPTTTGTVGGTGALPPAVHDRSTTLSLVAVALASAAVLMAATVVWSNQHATTTAIIAAEPAAGPVVPNGQTKVVDVGSGEFYARPSTISVAFGTRLVLHVVNHGTMDHDLQLEGRRVRTGRDATPPSTSRPRHRPDGTPSTRRRTAPSPT